MRGAGLIQAVRAATWRRFPVVFLLVAAGIGPDASAGAMFRQVTDAGLPRTGKSFGATWADVDRDGRLDLLLLRHGEGVGVYLTRSGLRFARRDSCEVLPCTAIDQHGTAACDYDADGDWDLYVTVGADRGRGAGRNELWSPDPQGRYVDTLAAHDILADPTGRGRGALWLELTGDSHPELLVLNFETRLRLFSSDSSAWRDLSGRFLPAPRAGERRTRWYAQVVAGDLDGDGLTDLYLTGNARSLYRNRGDGWLVDVTAAAGLAAGGPELVQSTAGDLDGDGDLDLILAGRRPGTLQVRLNESLPGEMRFGAGPGLDHLPLAYELDTAQLADLDNDGNLDLYVTMHFSDGFNLPNLVARGRGDGSFQDMSSAWGGLGDVEALPCGAWPADLDRDGDLDLVLLHGKEHYPDRELTCVLYENTTTARGLTLELVSREGPPHGLGARVALATANGVRVRQVRAVMNYWSSSFPPLHFGVGDDPGPYRVTVAWPDGTSQTVELPRAGCAYSLVRGEDSARLLDAD